METRFSTFDEVERYLEKLPKFSQSGAKAAHFGLDHMEEFCRLAGNPQDNIRAVHVAGTNGKGTTCQMLASVYQQAGFRTGLYTSPHLCRFNERIRVNGTSVSDEVILDFFRIHESLLDRVPLTYFELSTCLAFWYLAREQCDISVIETGLGGRLDATNLVTPMVSVITSVSMDHVDILGGTLRKIAREKAGIIKSGKTVVTGLLPDEAMNEIKKKANREQAELFGAPACRPEWDSGDIVLTDPESGEVIRVKGKERKRIDSVNAAIAYTVVKVLQARFVVSTDTFVQGLESLDRRFPDHAHFQRLLPGRHWYFDGAHNAEAIRTLFEQILSMDGNGEPVFFLSIMRDKAVPEFLGNFQSYRYVYYIETGTERSANCNQILSMIPQAACLPNDASAIEGILEGLKSELVIFTGSFYFYPQVKQWMASQLPSDHT